ncbi:MAG: aminopeptidase P family protein, partial [Bacteroidota bacterium]
AFLALFSTGRTQIDPSDPLSSAFRMARRADLRANLPEGGCALVFSGGFRAHSAYGVVPRPFDPDPDFFYLTGLRVPDAVLVIFAAPRTLAEGRVQEVLFLPDRGDLILRYMGEDFQGKYGYNENGYSIRPATQWRKFCKEILAGDSIQKVLTTPFLTSDYRKRGDLAYIDLGSIFYSNMAPGFPFDPPAQRFYKEIVQADTSGLPALINRVTSYLNYFPSVRRDPILDEFSKVDGARALAQVQALVRRIKIDLVRLPEILTLMRQTKSGEELRQLRKSGGIVVNAAKEAARKAAVGESEAMVQGVGEFVMRQAGARPAMPSRVASGVRAALPYYNRNSEKIPDNSLCVVDFAADLNGYCTRITRTLPGSGTFAARDRDLYKAVKEIHDATIAQCLPGTRPSSLVKTTSAGFESIFKDMDIAVNKAGKGKVVKVVSISPIGLDLNELDLPPMLTPKMVFEVETAFYIPQSRRIQKAWHHKGIVLRDVVLVTESGPEVLTKGFSTSAEAVEALCKEISRY